MQASRDDLTGIPNRAAILGVLRRSLEQARQGDTPVSIILADVDRFKQINDTYGHPVGDTALRRLRHCCNHACGRRTPWVDTVARSS